MNYVLAKSHNLGTYHNYEGPNLANQRSRKVGCTRTEVLEEAPDLSLLF